MADDLWTKSPEELARYMRAQLVQLRVVTKDYDAARHVLEAKTLVALERTARWTFLLAIATFTLALATVVIAALG